MFLHSQNNQFAGTCGDETTANIPNIYFFFNTDDFRLQKMIHVFDESNKM